MRNIEDAYAGDDMSLQGGKSFVGSAGHERVGKLPASQQNHGI